MVVRVVSIKAGNQSGKNVIESSKTFIFTKLLVYYPNAHIEQCSVLN
jgi:hypothetical protein